MSIQDNSDHSVELSPSKYPGFLGESHPERPLNAGSIIEANGVEYEVVLDEGLDALTVKYNGVVQDIEWDLGDVMCTVLKVASPKRPSPRPQGR